MVEKKTIHDSDDGDSPLYVGIKYLGLIARQMQLILEAEDEAYERKGEYCLKWLNRLRGFYNLVANKTDVDKSEKEIILFEYKLIGKKLQKVDIKIKEKEKYAKWFTEIEMMIERNFSIVDIQVGNFFKSPRYLNDKKIILELGTCERELYRDANSKHLIMPEGLQDMKELVKNEWLDREAKKEF